MPARRSLDWRSISRTRATQYSLITRPNRFSAVRFAGAPLAAFLAVASAEKPWVGPSRAAAATPSPVVCRKARREEGDSLMGWILVNQRRRWRAIVLGQPA